MESRSTWSMLRTQRLGDHLLKMSMWERLKLLGSNVSGSSSPAMVCFTSSSPTRLSEWKSEKKSFPASSSRKGKAILKYTQRAPFFLRKACLQEKLFYQSPTQALLAWGKRNTQLQLSLAFLSPIKRRRGESRKHLQKSQPLDTGLPKDSELIIGLENAPQPCILLPH